MGKPLSASCQVPSKLILCGEHSVLYGTPALSLAINLPTECQIFFTPSSKKDQQQHFQISLPDLNIQTEICETEWLSEIERIKSDYASFCSDPKAKGRKPVLDRPHQLILLCLNRIDQYHKLPQGLWQIKIHSKNWLGRGMGSSAAVILATLMTIARSIPISLNNEQLLKMATEIESFQHGRSSGLDPATILAKTVIEYRVPNQIHSLGLKSFPLPAWLIDTGKPQSSTGSCVMQVRQQFAENSALWEEFAQVVQQIKRAWQSGQNRLFVEGIRHNQKLLEQIGVVPQKMQQLIEQLNKLDAHSCAKVCGAGSISGDAAGVVIYFGERAPDALCQRMGYKIHPLELYKC